MLMAWLLKYDGYPPGVLVALLLHGLLLYILLPSEADPEDFLRIQPPAITAVVTQDNPQRQRRVEQLEQQRQADAARQRQQAERQRQAEQQRQADQQRQAEAKRQEEARVAEASRQAEARRQEEAKVAETRKQEEARQAEARRQEEQRQVAERQRQEEAQRQAAAAAAAAEAASNAQNDLVAQFSAIIHALVSDNWSRPPSARNGMSVVLNLRLLPTGEVVSATIIKSSGDAVFDRSAEQAVARVGSFSELRDLPTPVFERNFRNFNLEFRPEDLLR